jgi:hypothetical protein
MREHGFLVGIYALNADKIYGLSDWPDGTLKMLKVPFEQFR